MNNIQRRLKNAPKDVGEDIRSLLTQCLTFLMGFFLMPVSFIFDIYPFALCFVASCHSNTLFAFAGAILSVYFRMNASLTYAIALCAVVALRVIASLIYISEEGGVGLGMENRKDIISSLFKEKVGIRVAVSAVCSMGISAYSVILSDFSYYEIFSLLFFVASSSLLTFALCGLYSSKNGARSVGVCALSFSLSFLLKGMEIFSLDVSIILSYAAVLYASKNVSPSKGAALGGLLGICQSVAFSPVFAIGAVTSGFLWRFSVFISIMCALLLSTGYGIFASGYEAIVYLLPELLFASLIMYPLLRFEVLPRPSFVTGDKESITAGEIINRLSMEETKERFKSVSRSLRDISALMCDFGKTDKAPTPDSRYDVCLEICEEHCYSCPKRSICWERDAVTTKDNIEKLSTASYYSKTVKREDVDEKFLHRCPNIDTVIERINERTRDEDNGMLQNDKLDMISRDYESISRIIDIEADRTQGEEREDAALSERLRKMADSIGFLCNDIRAFGEERKRIVATGVSIEGSKCGAELLTRELSRAVSARVAPPEFEGVSPNAVMITKTVNHFDVQSAVFTDKTEKEEQNGDTVSTFYSSSDRFYMLVCDGMGTGRIASSTSKTCADFLKKLLSSHSSKENAVYMANNFIRSKKTECSSSVDLLEIDLLSGRAGFIKSGAAPSFVKRDGKVFRLFSKTAPIGIMKESDAETLDFSLHDGDTVLMVSDGICQNEDDSQWLADLFASSYSDDVSLLTRQIADRACERSKRCDDRTVAVCKISSVAL